MDRDDSQQVRALRDRLARLSEASLRINESLDYDTVLQGVLDSARTLTGARYGVIILVDDVGGIGEFLSSGFTPEEEQNLWGLPERDLLIEYLSNASGPLRLADFCGHLRAGGLPEYRLILERSPILAFLGTPVRYQGESVGHFFLGEKEAGEAFTAEDETTLAMFASQAAMVIANARRYREEQKARLDLETLIDTSPVGVVVIDARTGIPTTFNREAKRIVSGLHDADAAPRDVMEALTARYADGREVSLQGSTIVHELSAGEAVRAEEVVISASDGRNVTVLVNASPIRSERGEVETFVITLQDMTTIEELERLRAEFLAMVSHELRTPLATLKGSVTTLLDPPAALNPTESLQFFRIIDAQIDRMHRLISDLLDVARIDTGTLAIFPEPTDVTVLVDEARNGFHGGGGGHQIEIEIPPDLPWVMADRLRMVQVLGNLLNNAARHSPENSPLQVTATAEDIHVSVSVSDQGRGIRAESLPHLFRKFSRIESEEQGGDTGLGLAICKGIVEAHGGRIWAESEGPGLGARFTFTIPTVERSGFVSPAAPAQLPARTSRRGPAEEPVRILAVDDDSEALRYIRDALVKSGYEPLLATDPQEAPGLVEDQKPHLILLDLMLPGTDGIELMQEIRRTADVPVIFVSAYGQDQLVARAFDMGAADYVVKPFSPTELAARIRAALRRQDAQQPSAPYVLGGLTIDYEERRVTLAGEPVQLTDIEYRTLAELSANAGRVSTYEQLLRRVWQAEGDADVGPIRTVIHTLRSRLGDNADDPTYIFTQPRVGYRMPKGRD